MTTKEITHHVTETGCHECTSHICSDNGSPYVTIKGKQIKISRYLYEKIHGKIKKNLVLRHTCDNPKCINPIHLITGTQKQNMQDKVERGRMVIGNSSPLTKEQSGEIKYSLLTNKELSDKYKISIRTIQRIRNGYTWK